MAIHIDLELHREPRLEPHVDEAKVPVHEVVVEAQALPSSRLDEGRPFAPPEREGAAGFDHGEDADQPLLDPIALGQLACQLFLPRALPEVLVGPACACRHLPRVILEAVGLRQHEAFHLAPANPPGVEEAGHRVAAEERQIPPEQHPVKAG
jgi:hypothetical protein